MTPWYLISLLTALGGWATISVQDVPDYAVARQPLQVTFTVRQHGFSPLGGLEPRVEAEARGVETIAATASRVSGEAGRYTATLNLPQAGEWTITVTGRGSNLALTMLVVGR